MIIIILILLVIGGFLGFRLGGHFTRQENEVIRNNNSLLQKFSNEWASAARFSNQISREISQQNNSNVSETMKTVIQLLIAIKREESHTLNTSQQDAIQRIIDDAKRISPTSEFE